ncbi:MAG TPA: NAD(+)/NADH kinase [Myxococcota bacterium]|nr:NAD(+)/NADH kinase [Myxococcota bacterium]
MRALVVFKRSSLQIYAEEGADPAVRAVLRGGGALARALREADAAHRGTIAAVETVLRAEGVAFKRVVASAARTRSERADLVVSVGGDGTFLDAARLAQATPVLGVNSDPARSVGRFCAATRGEFRRVLRAFLAGRLTPVRLCRLRATTRRAGGQDDALNDLLIAHHSPSSTTSYVLTTSAARASERQRSSGLWISSAAGSTAAIRSAGGRVLPLRSQRLQFVVREPYRGRDGRERPRLRQGILAPGGWMEIEARMRDVVVYFDGGRVRWPLLLGETLHVETSPVSCHVLGIR